MASELENSSQISIDKLLQLNSNANTNCIETFHSLADYETCYNVLKEELNKFNIEVDIQEAEYKYKLEIANSLQQQYELLKSTEKRADALIKAKNYNVQLISEIQNLLTQKAMEREKQKKLLKKQLNDVYKESMKIFERDPLVIQRNNLRNQVEKRKFEIAFLKQKIINEEKVYANLKKVENQLEQNKIIKFAEAMVKYYRMEKERNKAIINKQKAILLKNKEESENPPENLRMEIPKKVDLNSFIKPSQNFLLNKSKYLSNIGSIVTSNLESLNFKPLQFPSLTTTNYQFNTKNYLNIINTKISKPDTEPARQINENKSDVSNSIIKPINIPKFDINFEKIISNKSNQHKNLLNQNKQRNELKRQPDVQKSVIKPKVPAISKYTAKLNDILNTTEKEERIFLSQPDNEKSTEHNEEKISLSQNSQKSNKSNLSQKYKLNKIKKTNKEDAQSQAIIQKNVILNQSQDLKETPNQKKVEINTPQKQTNVMNQMLNPSANISKIPDSNDNQKHKSIELNKQSSLPMFNLQITNLNTSEITTPTTKTVNFSNSVNKPLDTKSPYFLNQTVISSQEEYTSLNTSADQSDKIMNISNDQVPSLVNTTEEYFDTVQNDTGEDICMMNYNNEDCNMEEFYETNHENLIEVNPEMQYLSLSTYISPPSLSALPANEECSQQNISSSVNLFSSNQNAGNSFFSFGQSNSKPDNYFSMF